MHFTFAFIVAISTDEYFIETMETLMENSNEMLFFSASLKLSCEISEKISSGSNHPFLPKTYKISLQKLWTFLSLSALATVQSSGYLTTFSIQNKTKQLMLTTSQHDRNE